MPTRLPLLALRTTPRPPTEGAPKADAKGTATPTTSPAVTSSPSSPVSAVVHKPFNVISRFGSTFFNRKPSSTAHNDDVASRKRNSATGGGAPQPPHPMLRRGSTENHLISSMPSGDLARLLEQSRSARNLLQPVKADVNTTTAPSMPLDQPPAATTSVRPMASKEDDARKPVSSTHAAPLIPHRPEAATHSSSGDSTTTHTSSLAPRRPNVSKRSSANESAMSSIVAGPTSPSRGASFRNISHFDRSKADPVGTAAAKASLSQLSQGSNDSSRESGDGGDQSRSSQYVLAHHASELTLLETKEITAYSEVLFFSTLAVKKRRHNGRIVAAEKASAVSGSDCKQDPTAHIDSLLGGHELPLKAELFNDGYDDERGDYVMLTGDHLSYRYEVLHPLGSGSFGQVVCCVDHASKSKVAVKVIRNRKKYKEQALVEIQMLSQLQEHRTASASGASSSGRRPSSQPKSSVNNVVQMIDHFLFRNHLCISFELLGMNLYEYLKLRFFQGMPMPNIRVVASQVVRALAHLQAKHIIHCDLKPENILVKSPLQCFAAGPGCSSVAYANVPVDSVCLIDFGSSCLDSATIYTYIQSRFYRSPEVILGHAYGTATDMWSLGCILVELHTGHPLFAGESETEQLHCMLEILGLPSATFLAKCKRRKYFFHEVQVQPDEAGTSSSSLGPLPMGSDPSTPASSVGTLGTYQPLPFTNSRGRKRVPGNRDLLAVLKSDDADFVAFVRKCFTWEPSDRLTPEAARAEPWMLLAAAREPGTPMDV